MMTTPRHSLRVADKVWKLALRRAELEHRTLTSVVQTALRDYAEGRYDAIEIRRLE
jgi:hypothetical protein